MMILNNLMRNCRFSICRIPPPLHKYCTQEHGDIIKPTQLQHSQNTVLQNIKSTSSSYDLFEIISLKSKQFTPAHVMESLKCLFNLQKRETTSIQTIHILNNPDFITLCHQLKSCSKLLDLNDVIEALKILNYLNVPPNSEIYHLLLTIIRTKINDITLGHVMFLEFLLRKVESTPLVEALRMALPILMDIQLSTQMDYENRSQLTELLTFASRNQLSNKSVMNIVSALTIHGDQFSADEAWRIVWSLADLKAYNSLHQDKLLENALSVFRRSMLDMPFEIIETTLSKFIEKYTQNSRTHAAFYNEQLYNDCVNYVLEKDVGFINAIYVQRKLNKINYVSLKLLNYLSERILEKPHLLSNAKPTALFTYVTALATANYKPTHWNRIASLIWENNLIKEQKNELPWIKFFLELMSLGVYDTAILSNLFDIDFLEKHLMRTNNTYNYLQLLTLHQAVQIFLPDYDGKTIDQQFINYATELTYNRQETPLKESVKYCFGGADYVRSNVKTRFGHFIDHIVVFDENGEPVPWHHGANDEEHRFEDIKITKNQRAIGIISFPKTYYCLNVPQQLKGLFELKLKTLEAIGIPMVAINLQHWLELPDREKIPYIEREAKYKLSCK